MSASGLSTWELASTALVTAAYRKLGYLALGQTLDVEPLANGVEALNAIIAYMQTKGMPLWKRTTLVIPLVLAQQTYNLQNAVKLAQVSLVDIAGGTKYDLIQKSLYDFNNLPTSSTGVPVHYTYTGTNLQGLNSTFTIWPIPDAGAVSAKSLSVVYQKEFDGMFTAVDTLDFPPYWTQGIIYKLAYSLAPETGLPPTDRALLRTEAEEATKAAQDYGDEDGSLYIQPDRMSIR